VIPSGCRTAGGGPRKRRHAPSWGPTLGRARRSWSLFIIAVVLLGGCGGDDGAERQEAQTTRTAAPGKTILVAALGDSINAGSPLWDPNPETRAQIGARADERSQWEYWVQQRMPDLRFRNCGVFGERTDEIAERLDRCAGGAKALVVQGGINDIVQGRPVADAARNLEGMVKRGKARGMGVVLVEVLPWNNGHPQAAPFIDDLNRRIREIGARERVAVLPWFKALEDTANPGRMAPRLTDDGDHPSVEGYKRLAETVRLPVGDGGR